MNRLFYSFDIFDTCFVRSCGFSHNIFDLLAYRVLGENSSKSARMDFVNIRIQAEKKARLEASEEVTLEDIYVQCNFKGLTSLSVSKIAEMEIYIEKEQLTPVKSLLDQVNELHARGNEVAFISDMYLPETFILSLLKENKFWKNGDKLYVSCAYNMTKRTGSLYDLVVKQNHIKISQWHHYGDNKHSDYKIPKKKGIKAHLIKHEFTYYEKNILKQAYFPNFFIQQHLAGISKSVRLFLNNDIRVDFAADLIAPLYVSFVYDILEDAHIRNIKKLFFLARDGYILYLIAQEFKNIFPNIELYYLYVSRVSLYFPGLASIDDIEIVNSLKPLINNKLTDLFIEKLNFDITSYITDDPMIKSENEGQIYLLNLLSNKKFKEEIKKQYIYRTELILNYFIQSGLTSLDYQSGIVDVRGTRNCHESINNILNRNGYLPVFGYYFEVTANRKSIYSAGNYDSILYSERYTYNKGMKSIGELCTIWEQYFSITNHKRTIGYEKSDDGIIIPIFKENSNKEDTNIIFEIHKHVILKYANRYKSNHLHLFNKFVLSEMIRILVEFSKTPNYKYLKAFEGVVVSGSKFSISPILNKISLIDIFHMLKYKNIKSYNNNWKRGSFVYSYPLISRYLLKIINRYFFS